MASPATSAGGSPVVRVAISDPQKQGEGMSAYISYKVAAEVSLALSRDIRPAVQVELAMPERNVIVAVQ